MLAGPIHETRDHKEPGPHLGRPNASLKVVLLGDLGVGKTCLRSQFVHHVFSNAYKATIGGDYLTTLVALDSNTSPLIEEDKSVLVSGDGSRDLGPTASEPTHTVNLQVWDTAGQERFNLISQAFYRGADVAILVYDITSYELLLSVRTWFSRFMQHCQVKCPGIVIVGNKLDRTADRAVDRAEVRDVLCRNQPGKGPQLLDFVNDWENDVLEVTCRTLTAVDAVFRRAAIIGVSHTNSEPRDAVGSIPPVVLDDSHTAHRAASRCAC